MHVDVAIWAKLGALAATDAPVFDDDFEILFASDRANRALGHAKRIAAGAAGRGHQKVIVTQAVSKQSRDAVMGLRASSHASIAARAIVEIDQKKILRFEQSLIQKIVQLQTGWNGILFDRL